MAATGSPSLASAGQGRAWLHGAPRWWLPRRSLRLRLTLLYGAVFLASGAVLLAITYLLVSNRNSTITIVGARTAGLGLDQGPLTSLPGVVVRSGAGITHASFQAGINAERSGELDQLLTQSGIALAIMAVVSMGLGWIVAGRALRPIRAMAARAQLISAHNLHERLAVAGPDDELKELADSFDRLLARLQRAFEAQRRFVANASHELRTPLTLQRAVVEVSLADSNATAAELRASFERVLASGEHQERLIEALLTLARSQRGLEAREPLELDTITAEMLAVSASAGLRFSTSLAPAHTAGDRRLLERLVANLIDNAVRHNVDGGWVEVHTRTAAGTAILSVSNSGPVIAPEASDGLLEPFCRLPADRTSHGEGLGLGLSIVAAIADAHHAALALSALPDGGLEIEVRFPCSPARLGGDG